MRADMRKRDIKRYTLAQLKARLARRGGVLRTRPDAPTYELDDTFWREASLRVLGRHVTVAVAPPGWWARRWRWIRRMV